MSLPPRFHGGRWSASQSGAHVTAGNTVAGTSLNVRYGCTDCYSRAAAVDALIAYRTPK